MLLTSALLSCLIASYQTFPFNLHVLSLPPAFVLSQDQTLIFDSFNPACLNYSKEFLRFLISIHRLYSFSSFSTSYNAVCVSFFLFLFTLFYNCELLTFSVPSLATSGVICQRFSKVNTFFQKKLKKSAIFFLTLIN